jgi:hypothetical protein
MGALIGAFLGSFLGTIAHMTNLLNMREIKEMVTGLCAAIASGDDYNSALKRILDWVVAHLDILRDKYGYHIGMVINGRDDNEQVMLSGTGNLFKIGGPYDHHVDPEENKIELAGLVNYFLRNPGRPDLQEFELLRRIREMKSENIQAQTILNWLYMPEQIEEFRINGIFSAMTGGDFVSGTEEASNVISDMIQDNLFNDLSMYVMLNNVDLTDIQHFYNFDNDSELNWINSDKTRIYTYSSLNRDAGQTFDGTFDGKLATGPMSGFTFEKDDIMVGLGDMQLPHINYNLARNPDDFSQNIFGLSTELPFNTSGFQMASRKEGITENNSQSNSGATVKNPGHTASYKLMDEEYETAVWEFSILSGEDLTHIMVVDGDFLRAGDPWYLDILHKSGIRGNANVGFVRECDTEDNTVNNYIGTLKVDIMGGARKFVPFNGKQK